MNSEQRRIAGYLEGLPPMGDLRLAKVNALQELRSETQDELDALLPSAEGATAGRGVQWRVVMPPTLNPKGA